jgi:hypothetical protein
MPRKVTVNLCNDDEKEHLTSTLRKLGYPLIDDDISGIESAVTKGMEFISCATDKFNPTKEK